MHPLQPHVLQAPCLRILPAAQEGCLSGLGGFGGQLGELCESGGQSRLGPQEQAMLGSWFTTPPLLTLSETQGSADNCIPQP